MGKNKTNSGLGAKNWIIILVLGTLGNVAWSIENVWFNTFIYDEITTNPQPIAITVAVSALVATVATLIMGTVSDRVGKRKPFILLGYLLWGVFTALFPVSAIAKTLFMQTTMIVLLDGIMTFFGSTAYDAAFNAWTTDISNEKNRGKIASLMFICTMLGGMVLGGAGSIIDNFGYIPFFVGVGAVVSVTGLIGGLVMKDADNLRPRPRKDGDNFVKQFIALFNKESLQKNKEVFLLLASFMCLMIGYQVSGSYDTIYIHNYLGISYTVVSLLGVLALPASIAGGVVAGIMCDKGKGWGVVIASPVIFAIGGFLMAGIHNVAAVAVAKVFMMGGLAMMNVSVVGMFKSAVPEDGRGQFEGVRMVFVTLIPSIIGPQVGSALISVFGVQMVVDGENALVPTPIIYTVTAVVAFVGCLIAFFASKRVKKQ